MNVMAALAMGTILCGVIGVASYYLGLPPPHDLFGWFSAMGNGNNGHGRAGDYRHDGRWNAGNYPETGGINYIIDKITARVHGKRGSRALHRCARIAGEYLYSQQHGGNPDCGKYRTRDGDKFGVDNRKAASILDTFSCMVQGMIPYGVQMLLAAGLAGISPMDILPYLYYPVAIGIAALLAIIFRYPKRYN